MSIFMAEQAINAAALYVVDYLGNDCCQDDGFHFDQQTPKLKCSVLNFLISTDHYPFEAYANVVEEGHILPATAKKWLKHFEFLADHSVKVLGFIEHELHERLFDLVPQLIVERIEQEKREKVTQLKAS